MKKIFYAEGLKCGHCASKIQEQIEKLGEVESCILNFYTKKITVEFKNSVDEKEFLNTINKIADKTEKGAKIFSADRYENSEKDNSHHHHHKCNCGEKHEHEEESCSCGHEHHHGHSHEEECGCEEHKHAESCSCGHHHEEEHSHKHGECCSHNHSHEEKHSHTHSHEIKFSHEEEQNEKEKSRKIDYEKISLFGGLALFVISLLISKGTVKTAVLLTAYIVAGGDVLYKSLLNIKNKNFLDENFLMSIATIGAIFLKEYNEAVGVMIFYKIGEYFQEKAVNNSRKSIQSLLEVKASYANIKLPDGRIEKTAPENLKIGDIIVVKPGEKIAVDGVIIKGASSLDTSALTGESLPVFVEENTEVLSGSLNVDGMIEIKVTKEYKDSAISKIIEMVENASDKKAQSEKFITKFARYYTPFVVLAALVVGIGIPMIFGDFKLWFGRALIFLVISCPCALVLSVPLTFFSSIGLASKRGILIKGGNYLEKLKDIEAVVFDKTGTLTKGKFKIEKINCSEGFSENEVLEIGKAGEFYSNHPIGKAVLNYKDIKISETDIKDYKEISGKGVSALYKEKNILVGNKKLMEDNNIAVENIGEEDGTTVYIALNNEYIGSLHLADEIKNDSSKTLEKLKKMNIKTYMLTGDNKKIGESVGKKLGFEKENVFTGLLPQDKVSVLNKIKEKSKGVIFVGDGINDAPVLSLADIGIAMGGAGSDIAVESADIVFINDEPYKVVETLKIAAENKKVVMQNIYFSLGVKLLVMILGVIGLANMWLAIFADVGVSAIAVLNASKILRIKKL